MTASAQTVELDIRRKSQELAVAWRKGKAAFVLDTLSREEPLRAALMSTLIHEALAKWDPYDSRWPNGFRHALLSRSQGRVTAEEFLELEKEYRRQFGSSPPRVEPKNPNDDHECMQVVRLHVQKIRAALETGRPMMRERRDVSSMFLRPQTARRTG
jgi:hypothetical protein